MLEIFGSVFGRSKKSASNLNSPGSASQRGNNLSESTSNILYPTILTDELIKSPAKTACGSSLGATSLEVPNESTVSTTTAAASSEGSSIISLPFASPRVTMQTVHINPMDNVPFVPSLTLTAASGSGFNSPGHPAHIGDSMRKAYSALDRISLYLSSSSQSQYNFSLERSVTLEPSSSPTWLTNGRK